jgi:hypothetical protein
VPEVRGWTPEAPSRLKQAFRHAILLKASAVLERKIACMLKRPVPSGG